MKKHLALALAFIIMSVTACGGAAKGTGQAAEPAADTIQSEAPVTEEAASPAEASPSETAAAETAQTEVNVTIPYWTEGSAVADSIVAYVKSVTDESSDSYVAPADRIAIFDFDGTLYGERYPTYFDTCLFIHRALHDETFTAPDDIREYAKAMEEALYNHLPEPDSDKSTAQCAAECFKGMTTEEYREYVKTFMASPAFGFEGMTYAEGFYKPMIEVVKYLAENDFTIFISSGSERAMVRELIKGSLDEWIPADRVIGSTFSLIASGQGSKAGRKYTISADDQILIVLPLDPSRIDFILEDGLFPYLRDTLDIGEFVDDPLKGITGEADGVAVGAAAAARAEEAAAVEEKPAEPVKKGPYDVDYLNEVIAGLRDKGLTVAVATTKTVDFLKSISETVNMDRVIFLSPYTFAKNDMKADEYAVKLAKGAFDTSEASLGASLTKVYAKTNEDGTKSYYMYASISDGKTANQAKIRAKPGDTPPQLIYKSIEVLFRMMDPWSGTGYAEPQYTSEAVVDEDFAAEHAPVDEEGRPIKDAGDKRKSTQKTVATALIGASAVGSAVISLLANNLY